MSTDDVTRSIAKRQIARLIGGSSYPIFVLSDTDQLVFANDALGVLLDREPDELLGTSCKQIVAPEQSNAPLLEGWLALPPNTRRDQITVLDETIPPSIATRKITDAFGRSSIVPYGTWTRCIVPLDSSLPGAMLCFLKPFVGESTRGTPSKTNGRLRDELLRSRARQSGMNDLWFLHGRSPASVLALQQYAASISNHLSLCVFGPAGSHRDAVVHAVANGRQKTFIASEKESAIALATSLHGIDCRLMDNDLLAEMFEVILETVARNGTASMLLQGLDVLPAETVPQMAAFLQSQNAVHVYATSTASHLTSVHPTNRNWQSLVSCVSANQIHLPALSTRTEDIELLVAAWLDQFGTSSGNHVRPVPNHEFLDAMIAYSWPEDTIEFDRTMRDAMSQCDSQQLTFDNVPIAIRTFPSHVASQSKPTAVDLDAVLEDVERTMILRALERFPRNRTAAAKLLNISRARLLRRLQQWGLSGSTDDNDNSDDEPMFREVDGPS